MKILYSADDIETGDKFCSSKLIPKENAMILWNEEDDAITELVVTDKDSRKFDCSGGACHSFWKDLSLPDMITNCWQILLTYAKTIPEKQKECIYQFGKIKELEVVRHLYYRTYLYMSDMTYEEFLEEYYGD